MNSSVPVVLTQIGRWWTNFAGRREGFLAGFSSHGCPSSTSTARPRAPGSSQTLQSTIHTISYFAFRQPRIRLLILGLSPILSSPIIKLTSLSGWSRINWRMPGIAGSSDSATVRISSNRGYRWRTDERRHSTRCGSVWNRPGDLMGRRMVTPGALSWLRVADTASALGVPATSGRVIVVRLFICFIELAPTLKHVF